MATPLPVEGVRISLWRAVALFRLTALAVAVFLITRWQPLYERPDVAAAVAIAMVVVTAALGWLAVLGQAHRAPVVLADIVITAGLTLLTIPAQTSAQQHGGMVTLTTIWAAGPTIEAAFLAGPIGGVLAAVVQCAASAYVADTWHGRTLYSGVLLLLTGLVVGYVARLAVRAETDLRQAEAQRAALAERERLARSIHDGVLQVLGLVARTGRGTSGQWGELAAEAGRQEAALRALITSSGTVDGDEVDLAAELRALRSDTVTVATPEEVVLPPSVATGVRDAVRAALQNVSAHGGPGARAWVFLEEVDPEVQVTVRDDRVGFETGRLEAAARSGRIGVSRSIRGRIEEVGGRCTITSVPGEGTTIVISVPR